MALQVCSQCMVLYTSMKLCMISFSVAPMDYSRSNPVTLEFENCNMAGCHCIPIVDDDIFEGNEMFYVTLERASDRDSDKIVLRPVNGTIQIIDNVKCEYIKYKN